MNSVVSFIIVLGLLIFVHELGHFLLAKLFGVRVLKFSLGFGPKLFGRRYGDTEYLISAFPLGGYVKMTGENIEEEVTEEEKPCSFAHKPIWQRFFIVLAGPLFNLFFAVAVFFLIFATMGLPVPEGGTTIGAVNAGSPADKAGVMAGDVILSIDGQPTGDWEDVSLLVRRSDGREVLLELDRKGERLTIRGTPQKQEVKNIFGEVVEERYMLGISRGGEVRYERASIIDAFLAGLRQTWSYITLTAMGIIKIIQRVVPASELGGPILIAQMAGQQMEAGWINLAYFIGLLSVNLGILNLFPIPVLDGGHLVLYGIEAVRGKPLDRGSLEKLQQIGLVLLGSLMIFVFYNDIVRIFSKG